MGKVEYGNIRPYIEQEKERRNEKWVWNKWIVETGTRIRTEMPFYKTEELFLGPYSEPPSPQILTLILILTTSLLPQAMAALRLTQFPLASRWVADMLGVGSDWLVAEPHFLIQGHDGPAYDVKFYDDSILLSCGDDGRIRG
ncbi:hypothetical protein OROMI_002409 [Orobanche minor]